MMIQAIGVWLQLVGVAGVCFGILNVCGKNQKWIDIGAVIVSLLCIYFGTYVI